MASKIKRTIVRGNVIENPPPAPVEVGPIQVPSGIGLAVGVDGVAVVPVVPVAQASDKIAPIDITIEIKDSPGVAAIRFLGPQLVINNKFQNLIVDADRNLPVTIRITQG